MSTIVVTAIYDLRARHPDYFNRGGEEYIALLDYMLELGYPVYCFTESTLADKFPKHENLRVKIRDYDQLITHKLIRETGRTVKHAMVEGVVHPGHVAYAIVNNAKIFMIHEIVQEVKAVKYIWLDAGISHVDPCPIEEARKTIQDIDTSRNTLFIVNFPQHIACLEEQWDINRFEAVGGMMCFVPHEIEWFIQEYILTLSEAYQRQYVCLEEQIIPTIIRRHMDRFNYRFTDYRPLSNAIYPIYKLDIVIRNINLAPPSHAIPLVKRCLDGIIYGITRPNVDEMCYLLYWGHIISFYHDRELSDKLARIITMLIKMRGRETCTRYKSDDMLGNKIRQLYPNIETNITFNNITVPDNILEYHRQYPTDVKIMRLFL